MLRRWNLLLWSLQAWNYRLRVEPRQTRYLLGHLCAGETVIEISNGSGASTYWLAQAVGQTGRVIAFVEDAKTARRLLRRSAQRTPSVTVENLRLFPGTSPHSAVAQPGAMGRSSNDGGPQIACFTGVRETGVTTLDQYLRDRPGLNVNAVRFDNIGYELEILQGAKQMLVQQRPRILFASPPSSALTTVQDNVLQFLARHGYHGYFFAADGLEDIRLFDAERHRADPSLPGYVRNFLFMPAPRSRQLAA
jgi:FkbM family methyltransferase